MRRFPGSLETTTVMVALVLAACESGSKARPSNDTMTTRERQEAIGRSGIPGAGGINRALDAADSATARNRRLDSITP
jgi:hypothetical protein